MTKHTADLQKAAKRTAKGHLSEAKRPSFGRQKGTFCKYIRNRLIFNMIHDNKKFIRHIAAANHDNTPQTGVRQDIKRDITPIAPVNKKSRKAVKCRT